MEKIKEKKILHVTDAYAAGVMTAVNELVEMQINAGNSVTLLVLEREKYFASFPHHEKNLEIISFGTMNARRLLRLILTLRSRAKDYHFIHLHSSRTNFFGRLILLDKRNICQIYTPHGFSFLRKDINPLIRTLYFALEAFVAKLSPARLVGVSSSEVELGAKLGAKQPLLLHNSINLPSGLMKTQLYTTKISQVRVAFVGRNTAAKDPDFFLNLVHKCCPEIQFKWIGADQDEFVNICIPKNLEFFGFQSRTKALQILSEQDALIVTSLWEGLPTNIIEAQKLGIVVFMRNTLRIPELISHGETGYIFSDAEEFKKIILDPEFHSTAMKISQKAKKQADMNFTSGVDNHKWMNVYVNAKLQIN